MRATWENCIANLIHYSYYHFFWSSLSDVGKCGLYQIAYMGTSIEYTMEARGPAQNKRIDKGAVEFPDKAMGLFYD